MFFFKRKPFLALSEGQIDVRIFSFVFSYFDLNLYFIFVENGPDKSISSMFQFLRVRI